MKPNQTLDKNDKDITAKVTQKATEENKWN